MENQFNEDHPHLENYVLSASGGYSPTSVTIEEIIIRFVAQGGVGKNTNQIHDEVKAVIPMQYWMIGAGLRMLLDNGYIKLDNDIFDLTPEMKKRVETRTLLIANDEIARRIVFGFDEGRETREVRALRYILQKEPRSVLEFVLMDRLAFSISEYLSYKRFMDDLIDRGLVLRIKKDSEDAYCLSTGFHLMIRQQQQKKKEMEPKRMTMRYPVKTYDGLTMVESQIVNALSAQAEGGESEDLKKFIVFSEGCTEEVYDACVKSLIDRGHIVVSPHDQSRLCASENSKALYEDWMFFANLARNVAFEQYSSNDVPARVMAGLITGQANPSKWLQTMEKLRNETKNFAEILQDLKRRNIMKSVSFYGQAHLTMTDEFAQLVMQFKEQNRPPVSFPENKQPVQEIHPLVKVSMFIKGREVPLEEMKRIYELGRQLIINPGRHAIADSQQYGFFLKYDEVLELHDKIRELGLFDLSKLKPA